jgi:hypothetical protein
VRKISGDANYASKYGIQYYTVLYSHAQHSQQFIQVTTVGVSVVYSAPNTNEYQEYFLGVNAAGA